MRKFCSIEDTMITLHANGNAPYITGASSEEILTSLITTAFMSHLCTNRIRRILFFLPS